MIKNIILLLLIIGGWSLMGIGFTIKSGHPTSTILFVGGFILIIFAIISLSSSLKTKFDTKSKKWKILKDMSIL